MSGVCYVTQFPSEWISTDTMSTQPSFKKLNTDRKMLPLICIFLHILHFFGGFGSVDPRPRAIVHKRCLHFLAAWWDPITPFSSYKSGRGRGRDLSWNKNAQFSRCIMGLFLQSFFLEKLGLDCCWKESFKQIKFSLEISYLANFLFVTGS